MTQDGDFIRAAVHRPLAPRPPARGRPQATRAQATRTRDNGVVISVELATALRDAGLVWRPRSGDRFMLTRSTLDGEVFVGSPGTELEFAL